MTTFSMFRRSVCAVAACSARAATVWVAALLFGATAAVAQPEPGATLDERLEWLAGQIEERRASQHIAGLSVAIVLDGETVFARGFGLRDVERGIAAQADTVYCIGSTTKHMTAALVAQADAEGVLSLDEHPSRLVPGFALMDELANNEVNFHDLLSHRTGLTRMSLLWYGGTSTFDDMLAGVPRAELYAPFRTQFLYNNVMYAVAGEAVARAYETTWPELMRTTLFEPVGMTDATTDWRAFVEMTRASKGYRWDEDAEEGEGAYEFVPLRHLDAIGPAGSVYATVDDMALWAKTLLNDGVAPDGTRVLAPGVVETISTEHIAMDASVQYGMGLFLREWNGLRVLEHGGNIDGFASAFALLPDKNAGVSVLMNAGSAPMQGEIANVVWRTLFPDLEGSKLVAEAPADDGAAQDTEAFDPASVDRSRLVGVYPAGALPFAITIEDRDGVLFAIAEGQPAFELSPPTAAGEPWTHEGRPSFSVSFVSPTGDDGKVIGMVFTQGPAEFTIAREGFADQLEAHLTAIAQADAPFTVDELKGFEGKYHFAMQAIDFGVVTLNGRLAVDIPGQTQFELNWPDDEGWWTLAAVPGAKVKFVSAEGEENAGDITEMKFEQGGMSMALPRVRMDESDLPGLDTVLTKVREALGWERWREGLVVRATGTSSLRHQGIRGPSTVVWGGVDTFASEEDLSPYGVIRTVVTPDGGWTDSVFERFSRFDNEHQRLEARFAHPAAWGDEWDAVYDSVTVKPRRESEGRTLLPVVMTNGKKSELGLYIDETTWLPAAIEITTTHDLFGRVTQRVELSDYRSFEGVMIPARLSGELLQNGAFEAKYTAFETLDEVPAAMLRAPDGTDG